MSFGPHTRKALREGANYSALLAAVVHAHICDDKAVLHSLLSGVDPIDARATANKLRVLEALSAEVRGGSTDGVTAETPPAQSVLSSPSSTPADADGAGQATAPAVPAYSVKVPCS